MHRPPLRLSVTLALACVLSSALPIRGIEAQDEGGRHFEVGVYEGVPWPIVPAPGTGPLPPSPRFSTPPSPGHPMGERVMALLAEVESNLRDNVYQHMTDVRPDEGYFHWDCSGMTAWILRRTARGAMRAITRERPVARDFVRAIERAPAGRSRAGWQRIERVADTLPGDLFSWRRPRGFPSRNTGHVGFVINAPLPVPGLPGAYAVRVADATSLGHQDDSRHGDPDGGYGEGTLVFLTDAEGRGTHYGWFGTQSEGYVVTPIFFGRVSR